MAYEPENVQESNEASLSLCLHENTIRYIFCDERMLPLFESVADCILPKEELFIFENLYWLGEI